MAHTHAEWPLSCSAPCSTWTFPKHARLYLIIKGSSLDRPHADILPLFSLWDHLYLTSIAQRNTRLLSWGSCMILVWLSVKSNKSSMSYCHLLCNTSNYAHFTTVEMDLLLHSRHTCFLRGQWTKWWFSRYFITGVCTDFFVESSIVAIP